MSDSNRIDVHHHFVPEFYKEAVISSGGDPSGWVVPEWTLETDAVVNNKFGVGTTILSLTAPGACILKEPQAAAKLARQTNELAAKYRDDQPNKYGFFAALPSLLDKDVALAEIAYALDTLKADGVTLFTRYGSGNHYLGHPDFKDIWAELNRRSAVVFIHPTHPVDTAQVSNLPQPVIRYPFETTQTALDMIHNKTVKNNPNCKIILSHAGGAFPYLVSRPASIFCKTDVDEKEFWDQATSFYFDTAVSGHENVLNLLENFAKPGHILYGSDTPYAFDHIIAYHNKRYDAHKFKDHKMKEAINRGNALALFPRLK